MESNIPIELADDSSRTPETSEDSQENTEIPYPPSLSAALLTARLNLTRIIEHINSCLRDSKDGEFTDEERDTFRCELSYACRTVSKLAQEALLYYPKTSDGTIPPQEVAVGNGVIRLHGVVHPVGNPLIPLNTKLSMQRHPYIKQCNRRFADLECVIVEQNLIDVFSALRTRAKMMVDHETNGGKIAYGKAFVYAAAFGVVSPFLLFRANPARIQRRKNEETMNEALGFLARQAPHDLIREALGKPSYSIHVCAHLMNLFGDSDRIDSILRAHYMAWYALEELRETGRDRIDVICGTVHVAEIRETLMLFKKFGAGKHVMCDSIKTLVARHRADKKYAVGVHRNTRYKIVQALGFTLGASLWLPPASSVGIGLGDVFSKKHHNVQLVFEAPEE